MDLVEDRKTGANERNRTADLFIMSVSALASKSI